jgi:hypothetical protein
MSAKIVPSRGVLREITERPKARFFGFLSLMWAAVAVIGVVILWETPVPSGLERIAWLLVLLELAFIAAAIFFWLTERPRRVVRRVHDSFPGGGIIR